MPDLIAAPIYTAVVATLAVLLSVVVIRKRRSEQISLGLGNEGEIEFAVRAHANLVEHAPLALILLAVYELNGGSVWVLHAGGLALVLGRLLHAFAFTVSPKHGASFGRVGGMSLTFTSYLILIPANVVAVLAG